MVRNTNEWSGVFTIAAFILAFLAVPVAAGKWVERLNNVEERVGELSQWNTSIGEVQKSVASMQTSITNIAGKTIFIPYRNQDKVLLFYGQLSNKQNWDGLCLLNVYCDNRLQFVSEAQFEDGRPISYKQVFGMIKIVHGIVQNVKYMIVEIMAIQKNTIRILSIH